MTKHQIMESMPQELRSYGWSFLGKQSLSLLLGALSGAMFAIHGLFVNLLNGRVDAIFLLFFRMDFIAIVFLIVVIYKNIPIWSYSYKDYLIMFVLSTFHTLVSVCEFQALQKIDLTNAITINATKPVFVAIFNFVFLKKRMTLSDFIQLCVCTVGCLLCTQPNFLFHSQSDSALAVSDFDVRMGYFQAFFAAAGLAIWAMTIKANGHIDAITIAVANNINGAVVSAIYLFAIGQCETPKTTQDIIFTVSAVIAAFLASAAFYVAIEFGSALVISIGETSTGIAVSAVLNFGLALVPFSYLTVIGCSFVTMAVITPPILEISNCLKTNDKHNQI